MGCETGFPPHYEYTSMNHPDPAAVPRCHPAVLEYEEQQPDRDSDSKRKYKSLYPSKKLLEIRDPQERGGEALVAKQTFILPSFYRKGCSEILFLLFLLLH